MVMEYSVERRGMQIKAIQKSNAKTLNAFSENKQSIIFNQLMEYLRAIKEEKFTGYIKINYSQGSIGRVERFEEILKR
jgi:hypothetical protein